MTTLQRMLCGYGTSGYDIVARSENLTAAVEKALLQETPRWEIGEAEGTVIAPITIASVPGIFCFRERLVGHTDKQRGHTERGYVYARAADFAASGYSHASLVAAVPPWEARGTLLDEGAVPPVVAPAGLEASGASVLAGGVLALLGEQTIALKAARPDELALALALVAALPLERRADLAVGLGIGVPIPRSVRKGVFRAAAGGRLKASVTLDQERAHLSPAPEAPGDLAPWLADRARSLRPLLSTERGWEEAWGELWEEIRGALDVKELDAAALEAVAGADRILEAADLSDSSVGERLKCHHAERFFVRRLAWGLRPTTSLAAERLAPALAAAMDEQRLPDSEAALDLASLLAASAIEARLFRRLAAGGFSGAAASAGSPWLTAAAHAGTAPLLDAIDPRSAPPWQRRFATTQRVLLLRLASRVVEAGAFDLHLALARECRIDPAPFGFLERTFLLVHPPRARSLAEHLRDIVGALRPAAIDVPPPVATDWLSRKLREPLDGKSAAQLASALDATEVAATVEVALRLARERAAPSGIVPSLIVLDRALRRSGSARRAT